MKYWCYFGNSISANPFGEKLNFICELNRQRDRYLLKNEFVIPVRVRGRAWLGGCDGGGAQRQAQVGARRQAGRQPVRRQAAHAQRAQPHHAGHLHINHRLLFTFKHASKDSTKVKVKFPQLTSY